MEQAPQTGKPSPTTRDMAAWISMIANVGVLVGLLFVAVQISQNTAALRASAYQTWLATNAQLNMAITSVGSQVLMGGDVAPDRYEAPKGFSLSLQMKSTAEAERIFHDLVEGGQVVVPLAKTFWAERFGMVVDRFGVPWLINCEGADQRAEV